MKHRATVCVIVLLCLLAWGLQNPVFVSALSLNAYKLSDYISDIDLGDEAKTITYQLRDITPYICCWQYTPSGVLFSGINGTHYDWQLDQNTEEAYFGVFPLGYRIRDEADLENGDVVLDISDILPGSPISLYSAYSVIFTPDNYDVGELHCSATLYYFMYKADGEFIGKQKSYGGSYTMTEDDFYSLDLLFEDDFVFPQNCAYICPFLHIYCYDTVFKVGYNWTFEIESYDLELATSISYVVENSVSMQIIKDKLDGINDSLGDIRDSIDSNAEVLGDQIDNAAGTIVDSIDNAANNILTGTPEQQQIADDFTGQTNDSIAGLESVGDAMNQVTTPVIDVDSYVPTDHLTSTAFLAYTGIFANLWDNNLFYTMFSILGMLCVVSYLIFASKR